MPCKSRIAKRRRTHSHRLMLHPEPLERRELLATGISLFQSTTIVGSGGRMDAISVQPGNSDSVLISGDMLSVGFSRDGGQSWDGRHDGIENYQAADFTWDPDTTDRVWMGTLGGPHVSDDAGETWRLARVGMPARSNGQLTAPVEKILFDPNDVGGDRLLAFEGDHREFGSAEGQHNGRVWISQDDGATWSESYVVAAGGNITDAEYLGDSGSRLMATVANQGVFVSDDDGVTWTARNIGLPDNLDALSVASHPTDENIAWVAIEGDGIYFTQDGGSSWSARTSGLTLGPNQVRYKSVELATLNPNGTATLYASNAPDGGSGEGVYKSSDGGLTWTHVLTGRSDIENGNVFSEGANPWWIEVDVNDPETIWTGSSARVVRSTDGGQSWADMLNDTTDNPDFFRGRGFQGWVSRNFEVNPFNSDHYIAQAMDSGKIMQSFDRGQTWTRSIVQAEDPLSDGYEFGYEPVNANVSDAIAAYQQWKSLYITDIGVPNSDSMLRVSHEPNGAGRSSGEFQGYGMLYAAYLEPDDSVLTKLWNYAEHYLNSDGLMPWNISAEGVIEGPSSALDGDVDIAMALETAAQRWPGRGWESLAETYIDNTIAPGKRSHLFTDPIDTSLWPNYKEGIYLNYQAVAYFEEFAERTNDPRWVDIAIPNTYDLLEYSYQNYPLPAWFVDVDGQPVTPDDPWNSSYNRHDAGATRTDWRLGTHYLMTGHADASRWSEKLADFFYDAGSQDKRGRPLPFSPLNLRSGYRFATDNNYVAGQPYGNPNLPSETMITAAGVVSMAAGNVEMADSIYNFLASDSINPDDGNMDNAMHVMGLLIMSGRLNVDWQSPAAATDPISPFGGGEDVAFASQNVIYAAVGQSSTTRPGVLRSMDAGATWLKLQYPIDVDRVPRGVHVPNGAPNELWVVTDQGLYRSTNADVADPTQVTWEVVNTNFATKIYRIESDPFASDSFYLSTDAGVFLYDGSATFEILSDSPKNVNQGGDMKMVADPHVEGRIYLANFSTFRNAEMGLWRYDTNVGWSRLFHDNWVRDVDVDPRVPNRLALITDKAPYGDTIQATGIWISRNGGSDWESHNDGLPMLRGAHVSFSPDGRELNVGLTGRGFYAAHLSRIPQIDFPSDGFGQAAEARPAKSFSFGGNEGGFRTSLFDRIIADEEEDGEK